MSMGRRQNTQPSLGVAHDEICPGPGHRFYETLNALLCEAAFDRRLEALCAPYYETAHVPGWKSVAPEVYFRMHLVGLFVFEGIESERVERTFAPVCETGGARRTRLRVQATFLALSASVRALLHCWHTPIRSRIGFSRAVEICHAPEHGIRLRHSSRCPAHTSPYGQCKTSSIPLVGWPGEISVLLKRVVGGDAAAQPQRMSRRETHDVSERPPTPRMK